MTTATLTMAPLTVSRRNPRYFEARGKGKGARHLRRRVGVAPQPDRLMPDRIEPTPAERAAQAAAIIDRISYMVLGTADADGRPWATPVYYATDGSGAFYWVSSHEARHSANIASRAEIGIVIFDSTVPIGTGQGVYIEATAEQLIGQELDRGLAVFSARSMKDGGSAWTRQDVEGETLIRMYRATARSYSMLAKDGQPDHRVPIEVGK